VIPQLPQRSNLGTILFLIYINDLDTGVMCWTLKFADDTKIFGKVNTASDGLKLQKIYKSLLSGSLNGKCNSILRNAKQCILERRTLTMNIV